MNGKTRKILFQFKSLNERNDFLDAHFADRQVTNSLGAYKLLNGENLTVYNNEIIYYKDVSDGDAQTAAEYYYDKGEFASNKRPIPIHDKSDWATEAEEYYQEDDDDHWNNPNIDE